MLDLAVIIPELAKHGGAERFLLECVKRWQHRHRVTLYASRLDERLLKEAGVGDGVACRLLTPYFEGPHSLLLNATLLPKLWEQEIGEHDVYHGHLWPTHLIDRHPMVWCPHEPARLLHDLRHEQPSDGGGARRLHLYPKHDYDVAAHDRHAATLAAVEMFDRLGRPDRIVANSRYSAGCLEHAYGRPVDAVIHPGVDVDGFLDIPAREDVFVCIGQLWPHKRIRLAIEAAGLVEGVQLYVVGAGPERPRLEAMIERLGLGDRVFLVSDLTNEEVRILLGRCLATVFAALREPFGIVVLESLASAKPVIAVDEGGYTEILDDACAFLVPPEPAAIAECMQALRDDKERARAMGRAGRRVAARHHWDGVARAMGDVIAEAHRAWRAGRAEVRREPPPRATRIGAHYYCWYGEGLGSAHWNDDPDHGGVTDVPRLGYYPSRLGSTVERHLDLAREAGLDFLLPNVHVRGDGPDAAEWSALEQLFAVNEARGAPLSLAVQLCPVDCPAATFREVAAAVREAFAGREAYLRVGGRPLLSVFWSGAGDGRPEWIRALESLAPDFVRLATVLRLYAPGPRSGGALHGFDGWVPYSPLDLGPPDAWEGLWERAWRAAGEAPEALRAVTVCPGYDDRHLGDPERREHPHRRVDRADGAVYRRTWDFAAARRPRPELVLVTSFNEFHENTHIEPSLAHGRRYLEMTRDAAARLRAAAGEEGA